MPAPPPPPASACHPAHRRTWRPAGVLPLGGLSTGLVRPRKWLRASSRGRASSSTWPNSHTPGMQHPLACRPEGQPCSGAGGATFGATPDVRAPVATGSAGARPLGLAPPLTASTVGSSIALLALSRETQGLPYLPTQNSLKITPSRSSTETAPVRRPIHCTCTQSGVALGWSVVESRRERLASEAHGCDR